MFWVRLTGIWIHTHCGSLTLLLGGRAPLLSTYHIPVAHGRLWGLYKVSNIWGKHRKSRQGFIKAGFFPFGLTECHKIITSSLMNLWTFVTSHRRPIISGPITQIVTESENKNPSSTEYWMIIVWAYKPSLRKTIAYWSQRVVCIQNILEPFFRKAFCALGEAGTQFIFGNVRIATQACFQIVW